MGSFPNRLRLRDLLIVLLIVAALSAIGIRILAARRWESRQVACESNLRALRGCAFNYAAQYGGVQNNMPSDTGRAFFMRLQDSTTQVVDRFEPFFGPISRDFAGWGRTSYRGPAVDVNDLDDTDSVAADKEGNLGRGRGGSVLFKMGETRHHEETDPVWTRARLTTKK